MPQTPPSTAPELPPLPLARGSHCQPHQGATVHLLTADSFISAHCGGGVHLPIHLQGHHGVDVPLVTYPCGLHLKGHPSAEVDLPMVELPQPLCSLLHLNHTG